jgi:hypothetical protein
LKRAVHEYVQEQSVIVEMRVEEDGIISEDTLPVYILGFMQRYKHKNMEKFEHVGYILNWMLLLEHFHNAVFTYLY